MHKQKSLIFTPYRKKQQPLHIGIAYNNRPNGDTPTNTSLTLEYDEDETIEAIKNVLVLDGHTVELIHADQDFVERLKNAHVDFIFNIAEGIRGESRESHVPAILEMLGIPYSGSGVLSQAVTLSKSRSKEILGYYHIPTPKYQLFKNPKESLRGYLKFPLIVKPDAQGSSAGIINNSVVDNPKALQTQIEWVIENFGIPVLVEEFCNGREFTVAIIGNEPPTVLPIIEITFDHLPNKFAKIDSYESKWEFDTVDKNVNPLVCPAKIPQTLQNAIEKIALDTFTVFECKDFCRIDIRLNKHDIPQVLDVNCLAGLNPNPKFHSRFPLACSVGGLSYEDTILTIVHSALKRNNLI